MSAEQQIDEAYQRTRLLVASRMLRAAQYVQAEHMNRVGKPNVYRDKKWIDNSKPGEYPRKRSGDGQKGVVFGPDTPEGIVAEGMIVRLGQTMPSKHMLHLEFGRYVALGVWIKFNRLGWRRTAADTISRVRALVTGRG